MERENLRCAFVRALHGMIIGFQPAGAKNQGGMPGSLPGRKWPTWMPHWSRNLGPGVTHLGARVALMIDPFGDTLVPEACERVNPPGENPFSASRALARSSRSRVVARC